MLFGLSSGASLATVAGVLIKVSVMLMLVFICKTTCHFLRETLQIPLRKGGAGVVSTPISNTG